MNDEQDDEGEPLGPHSGTATHRRLTADDLRTCFATAVKARPCPIPTLEQCEQLLAFVPDGPAENILLAGVRMPLGAEKARTTLLALLPQARTYWSTLCDPSNGVFNRLDELCRALNACQGLLTPETDLFPETSTEAGEQLAAVFINGMKLSAPDRSFGKAGLGPCTTFVSEALRRLGYGNVTHAGLAKRITRSRQRTRQAD